jgi:hypothetical protein
MAKAPQRKRRSEGDAIKVEPGADQRLDDILTKALNTPPERRGEKVRNGPPRLQVETKCLDMMLNHLASLPMHASLDALFAPVSGPK